MLTNYTIEPSLVTERKRTCLDRGSNTGPLDLQSNALPTELSKQVTFTERSTWGLEWFADSQKKKCQNRSLIAGLAPMVSKNKKPTGGIEPPTFRLQSECSTTKLSRRTRDISRPARLTYRNPPIAQLAERETVDGLTTDISRSLVRIRVGGYIFLIYFFVFFPLASTPCLLPRPGAPGGK